MHPTPSLVKIPLEVRGKFLERARLNVSGGTFPTYPKWVMCRPTQEPKLPSSKVIARHLKGTENEDTPSHNRTFSAEPSASGKRWTRNPVKKCRRSSDYLHKPSAHDRNAQALAPDSVEQAPSSREPVHKGLRDSVSTLQGGRGAELRKQL